MRRTGSSSSPADAHRVAMTVFSVSCWITAAGVMRVGASGPVAYCNDPGFHRVDGARPERAHGH